jgi:type IV pilus assembly protein PilW
MTPHNTRAHIGAARRQTQQGLTLVELLVAMVISAVVAIAAISALIVSRQGFSTVDAASQLRDNGRFAADLIQRLGVQAGFQDVAYAATKRATPGAVGVSTNPDPNVFGFNNAEPTAGSPADTATPRTGTTSVGYGSDVLVLRHQTVERVPGSGIPDGSMIDCAGEALAAIPTGRDDRVVSVLYVDNSSLGGEPALMCYRQTGGTWQPGPIANGVEKFQVLYGTDGVVPNTAPIAGSTGDSVADRYLRADQLTVPGDPVGTNANWRRVRSLRIGMVLRGPPNSSQERAVERLYPFGKAFASGGGTPGSALSSTSDADSVYDAPADGRLRQTLSFTVHLRNDQGL